MLSRFLLVAVMVSIVSGCAIDRGAKSKLRSSQALVGAWVTKVAINYDTDGHVFECNSLGDVVLSPCKSAYAIVRLDDGNYFVMMSKNLAKYSAMRWMKATDRSAEFGNRPLLQVDIPNLHDGDDHTLCIAQYDFGVPLGLRPLIGVFPAAYVDDCTSVASFNKTDVFDELKKSLHQGIIH